MADSHSPLLVETKRHATEAFDAGRMRSYGAAGLVASLVIYLSPLVAPFPLLDPDEGMHAAISQEMVDKGDWLTPRFCGEPFFDKPVLFFWMQCLSLKLFGSSTAAIRFPGLVCGWLGGVTVGWLGSRWFGREVGWVAALIQWTMILPLSLAQSAVHDVALVPLCNMSLLCLWAAQRDEASRPAMWTAAAGFWLGLACLAKGLLGWPLIGVGYVCALLFTGRLTVRNCLMGLLALLIGACVAAPWYVAMECAHPGFLWYYFIERHVLGFATSTQRHGDRSVWYYVPILIGGTMPWGLLLPTAFIELAHRARRSWNSVSFEEWLAVLWLLGGVGFLSLARSKLFTYLAPVFPAAALVSALFLVRTWGDCIAPWLRKSLVVSNRVSWCGLLLVLPIALGGAALKMPALVGPGVLAAGVGVWAALWVPFLIWLRGRERESFLAALGVICLLFVGVTRLVVPAASANLVQIRLAEHLNQMREFPPQLWLVEERLGSVCFYLKPELRRSLSSDRIYFVDLDHPPPFDSAAHGVLIAVPNNLLDRVEPLLVANQVQRSEAGHYSILRIVRRGDGP